MHHHEIILYLTRHDFDAYAIDLPQLIGGVAARVEGELAAQIDVLERLGEGIEADTLADAAIVLRALLWRQLREVTFGDDTLYQGAGIL